MLNQIIIENFNKLIKMIEAETDMLVPSDNNTKINRYRIYNLKKILKILINFNEEITNVEQISNIKGIGIGTINRINEILKTSKLAELKNYNKIIKLTPIIEDLMKVIGIGRITAVNLIKKYKINSVNELKKLSDSNKIELNDKIKLGLKYLGKFEGLIPRIEIDNIYDYLINQTYQYNNSMFITICGSYRRELKVSSDIDVLLCNMDFITPDDDYDNMLLNYVNYLHNINFLLDDITDKNIKTKYMGFCSLGSKKYNKIRRIDIRLVSISSYYTALMYFTGSYTFNQNIRLHAKQLGYKLNEYELYDSRLNQQILVLSEQDIFDKLNMKYLDPKDR